MDEDDSETEVDLPLSITSLSYYKSNEKDPYVVNVEDSDDEESMQVLPEDNLLTIGKVKKDCCTIEVYVFHEKTYNLFCHHDIILPTIPLCMEWLDFDASEEAAGNLLAVGTVGPDIDIWDLDVVNCLEPAYQLSGQDPASAKKAKKKRKQVSVTGHSDAVMSLSWNSEYRHALASGSADQTAALWDLQECKVVTSLAHD